MFPHEISRTEESFEAYPPSHTKRHSREETLAALSQITVIPADRLSVENLQSLLALSSVSLEEMVSAVSRDALLSLSVLRAANALAPLSKIGVEEFGVAVQILGVQRFCEVIQSHLDSTAGLNSVWDLEQRGFGIHSLTVALISQKLSECLKIGTPLCAYFAGLWHNVGKAALFHLYPEIYRNIVSTAANNRSCLQTLETQFFGVNHSEAGRIYANRCGGGAVVLEAIAHHDTPENAQIGRGVSALVGIATHLAHWKGLGSVTDPKNSADEILSSLSTLSAWTVLMAETGRKQSVSSLYHALEPFLETLVAELGTFRKSP